MIDQSLPIPFRCRASETPLLRALVRLVTGEIATPDNVAAAAIKVTKQGGTVTFTDGDPDLEDILLATPELGDDTFDDDTNDDRTEIGYNLHWLADAAAFPTSGHYVVQFLFTGGDDSVTVVLFEGVVRGSL